MAKNEFKFSELMSPPLFVARGLEIIFPPARILDVVLPDNFINAYTSFAPFVHLAMGDRKPNVSLKRQFASATLETGKSLFGRLISNSVSIAIAYLGIASLEAVTGLKVIPPEISQTVNNLIDTLKLTDLRLNYVDVVKLSFGWQLGKFSYAVFVLAKEIRRAIKETPPKLDDNVF